MVLLSLNRSHQVCYICKFPFVEKADPGKLPGKSAVLLKKRIKNGHSYLEAIYADFPALKGKLPESAINEAICTTTSQKDRTPCSETIEKLSTLKKEERIQAGLLLQKIQEPINPCT